MAKFYLTTSIPYVNAKPHLGHALEYTQGDVLARYRKQKGDEVYFVSGADENSLKIVQAAEKAGLPVQTFSDQNAVHFQNLIQAYNIGLDIFHRSSSEKHHLASKELWERCDHAGDIYKKKYTGLYCIGCEAFYKREDLTAQGECLHHPGKPVAEIEEENYFFRLSKYQDRLLELIKSEKYLIRPEFKKNEVISFLQQGLEDFSISRSKERARNWGVEVPNDPTQIMYVWFDALNVYRSAALDWWPANLHLIGKDIIRFHAIYWPAILLSAQLPLPQELFVHGFITVDGQKMSKSIGNVVDPLDLVKKYGTDPVRYYLLREIPADNDGDYSEEKFLNRYNSDLANGLGNFTSRVLTLCAEMEFASQSQNPESDGNSEIENKIQETKNQLDQYLEEKKFHDALAKIWELISFGDALLNEKKPWAIEVAIEKKIVLAGLLQILEAVTQMLQPFLPETAAKIHQLFNQQNSLLKPQKPKEPIFPRRG